jgi:hypothetical protein
LEIQVLDWDIQKIVAGVKPAYGNHIPPLFMIGSPTTKTGTLSYKFNKRWNWKSLIFNNKTFL